VEKILNPQYLDNEKGNFRAVQDILESTAPSSSAWVGEAGGAYNSGHHLVTDAFIMSFWLVQHPTPDLSFLKRGSRHTMNSMHPRKEFIQNFVSILLGKIISIL
jgi:hypothetical protein